MRLQFNSKTVSYSHFPPSTANRRRSPPCLRSVSAVYGAFSFSPIPQTLTFTPIARIKRTISASQHVLLPVLLQQRKVQLISTLLSRPHVHSKIPRALDENNGSPSITTAQGGRTGEVKRVTKETNVYVKINLDGNAVAENDKGIPFLDHMLDQLASHGLFDVHVKATGDIHIDDHHTNEDVALAIGTMCYIKSDIQSEMLGLLEACKATALLQALGDRKGINRFGEFSAPLDEALIHVSLDLSERPHLGYDLCIPTERVGTYDTQLVKHFFQSFVNTSGLTLHHAGSNSHSIIEATFKALARALRQATVYDPRHRGSVPSSKGVLSRT